VDAKDYEHEGLVEEEVDVEKTQVDEQKVERVFDDVPSLEELRQRPSCDESFRDSCTVRAAHEHLSQVEEKQVLSQVEAITSPLSSRGENKSSLEKRRIMPWMKMPWTRMP